MLTCYVQLHHSFAPRSRTLSPAITADANARFSEPDAPFELRRGSLGRGFRGASAGGGREAESNKEEEEGRGWGCEGASNASDGGFRPACHRTGGDGHGERGGEVEGPAIAGWLSLLQSNMPRVVPRRPVVTTVATPDKLADPTVDLNFSSFALYLVSPRRL